MRVAEIKLSGIKGFPAGDRSVDLRLDTRGGRTRWVVVAGRNGAGKTTFLQCIASALVGPTATTRLMETSTGW